MYHRLLICTHGSYYQTQISKHNKIPKEIFTGKVVVVKNSMLVIANKAIKLQTLKFVYKLM